MTYKFKSEKFRLRSALVWRIKKRKRYVKEVFLKKKKARVKSNFLKVWRF